jgi:hypothetical protein
MEGVFKPREGLRRVVRLERRLVAPLLDYQVVVGVGEARRDRVPQTTTLARGDALRIGQQGSLFGRRPVMPNMSAIIKVISA